MNLPLRVGTSPKLNIRGLIATENIPQGTILEKCPVILYRNTHAKYIDKTIIGNYVFRWDKRVDCVVLGYGSLYNHSNTPNVLYERNVKEHVMIYKAISNIKKGEELTINYNGSPTSKKKLHKDHLDFDKQLTKVN